MTQTQIPARPDHLILGHPVSTGVAPGGWATTTFEGRDGRTYVKQQKLTLGRKPPYRANWYVEEA